MGGRVVAHEEEGEWYSRRRGSGTVGGGGVAHEERHVAYGITRWTLCNETNMGPE